MAFRMKHGLGPFRQEATGQPVTNEQPTQEKPAKLPPPVKPDLNSAEFQGFGTELRDVPQGKPKNWVIRDEIKKIKLLAGDNTFTGSTSTTPAYTNRSGSWLGNVLTGSGYDVTKSTGLVNTTATKLGNKFASEDEKESFYDNLKTVLKEGQGATIVDGVVTPGGEHKAEFKYDKKKRAEAEYNKEVTAYTRQQNLEKKAAEDAAKKAAYDAKKAAQAKLREENQAKEAARLAKIYAERDAKKAEWAAAGAKNAAEAEAKKAKLQAERDAKKNGGKKPVEETQPATNEPVAQQNRTPFYQRGMMSDKMLLQNKNKKASATSPLEQNAITNEKLIGSKTTSIQTTRGGRRGTLTTTVNDYETPGSGNANTKKPMSDANWSKFVKENPDWNKGSNRSDSNESFKPDPEKPLELPKIVSNYKPEFTFNPIKPMPMPVTPKEEPKNTGFKTSTGYIINRGAEAKSGGGGGGSEKAKKIGCPGGCP
jgi:hypothetical protein